MRYFEKIGVLGIPDKKVSSPLPTLHQPQKWDFVIQRHDADKAGRHYDLRLGTTTGFSWALRSLPQPGQKVLAIKQPDHSMEYFDFTGEITDGYGKGKVYTEERGRVDVIKSSPSKLTFYYYPGSQVHKYSLIHTSGNDWLLVNHTVSKPYTDLIPEKLKYREGYSREEGDVDTPKIDGASSILILRKGKTPVLFSKRKSKRTGEQIEYTPKIKSLLSKVVPEELKTTVLRTEVYGVTPDNKEIPNRVLGGILNAGVWKSREMQKELKTPLRIAAYDITKYQGKDVSELPYKQKQLLIRDIRSKFPYIDIPEEVEQRVSFKEGRVIWRGTQPYKVKSKKDYDVIVRDIFPSINRERAGGFSYSFEPRGPVKGKVGTGFTHAVLREMLKNPKKYKGLIARVVSQQQHPSGALRAPSFKDWNWEKNL